MKLYFTDEQKKLEINKVEVEDIVFSAEYIEGEDKNWIMTGTAIVDGEVYNEFTIEFETIDSPTSTDLEQIMKTEWEWYDFLF